MSDHRYPIAAALGLLGLTLGGCLSVDDMAERTAMAESGMLHQKQGTRDRSQFERIYTYYPDHEVYYSSFQDKFFWEEKTGWQVGTSLPPSIDLSDARSELISLYSARPFLEHEQVVARYPAASPEMTEAWASVPTD